MGLQYFVNQKTEIARNTVPIGFPVENTEVLLLNKDGDNAEILGEIGIKSRFVALGYWNKPEISQTAFLPDPEGSGKRIYHTGDMGRLLPDGSIEFLGRKDHQVKIHGYRIETGEIEKRLHEHPAIKNQIVMAKEDASGDKRLVAYLVASVGNTPSNAVLRKFLLETLPDFMVPSEFIYLDALPLTPTGKVHRRALLEQDQRLSPSTDPDQKETFVAPSTSMESIIAEIWQDLLGIDRISSQDNFFDLGGHSLLSMQVVARLEKSIGLRINPRELIFQNLGQLAFECEKKIAPGKQPEGLRGNIDKEIREPFFFGIGEKTLFGCYHPPLNGVAQSYGIILCYPLGQEYIRSHRTFLQLAVRLAHAGFPVLRFDFFGTGDSAGDCNDGNIRQWILDISTAVDEIKKRSGLSKFCLVGLRLGGTLSVIAGARRNDIQSMVLWNPVVSGEAYVAELKSLQKNMIRYSYLSDIKAGQKDYTEILGVRVSNDLFSDLKGIDLLETNISPAQKLLIIDNGEDPATNNLNSHLANVGSRSEYHALTAPKIWLDEPNVGLVPHQVLKRILRWVSTECL